MSRRDTAVETVLRKRRPDPACWDAVVDAVCSGEPSYDADQVLIQAGTAIARHADRIAVDLRPTAGGLRDRRRPRRDGARPRPRGNG